MESSTWTLYRQRDVPDKNNTPWQLSWLGLLSTTLTQASSCCWGEDMQTGSFVQALRFPHEQLRVNSWGARNVLFEGFQDVFEHAPFLRRINWQHHSNDTTAWRSNEFASFGMSDQQSKISSQPSFSPPFYRDRPIRMATSVMAARPWIVSERFWDIGLATALNMMHWWYFVNVPEIARHLTTTKKKTIFVQNMPKTRFAMYFECTGWHTWEVRPFLKTTRQCQAMRFNVRPITRVWVHHQCILLGCCRITHGFRYFTKGVGKRWCLTCITLDILQYSVNSRQVWLKFTTPNQREKFQDFGIQRSKAFSAIDERAPECRFDTMTKKSPFGRRKDDRSRPPCPSEEGALTRMGPVLLRLKWGLVVQQKLTKPPRRFRNRHWLIDPTLVSLWKTR